MHFLKTVSCIYYEVVTAKYIPEPYGDGKVHGLGWCTKRRYQYCLQCEFTVQKEMVQNADMIHKIKNATSSNCLQVINNNGKMNIKFLFAMAYTQDYEESHALCFGTRVFKKMALDVL